MRTAVQVAAIALHSESARRASILIWRPVMRKVMAARIVAR